MPQLYPPNDLLDIVRLVCLGICVYAMYVLLKRYHRESDHWNVKTTDIWFALVMWTIGGAIFCIQGIALDRPLTPGSVLLIAAIFVTGKAIHRKGPWGGNAT